MNGTTALCANVMMEDFVVCSCPTAFALFSSFLCLLCRAELQRVLAEVTDHMEQQYSAHQYLEKLRSENESLALKEKERQVAFAKVLNVIDTVTRHSCFVSPHRSLT